MTRPEYKLTALVCREHRCWLVQVVDGTGTVRFERRFWRRHSAERACQAVLDEHRKRLLQLTLPGIDR